MNREQGFDNVQGPHADTSQVRLVEGVGYVDRPRVNWTEKSHEQVVVHKQIREPEDPGDDPE